MNARNVPSETDAGRGLAENELNGWRIMVSTLAPDITLPTLLWVQGQAELEGPVAAALSCDFRVVRAVDGDEALAIVKAEPLAVVLVAAESGDADGSQISRALRACAEGCVMPIIMISSSARPEDAARAFEAGANDYVVRPLIPGQLRARARTWLLRAALAPSRDSDHPARNLCSKSRANCS
jgi:DNA-binding response OmpR family regulator